MCLYQLNPPLCLPANCWYVCLLFGAEQVVYIGVESDTDERDKEKLCRDQGNCRVW